MMSIKYCEVTTLFSYWRFIITTLFFLFTAQTHAAKLAIVIDDFGYRHNTEMQVLNMPVQITIAILPNAPLRKEMMTKAHQQGREIIIHVPMLPISKQPLEKDTLKPTMTSAEIERIIDHAVANVPYAKGINNHMGSAMTADLAAMQKLMKALEKHHFFFLDSVTTGKTQATKAAQNTNVSVLKRNVFLDDNIDEAAVLAQFNQAIKVARRNGSAIAIGHPHPSTVKVLKQMLPNLPADIQLVKLSDLLNDKSVQDKDPTISNPVDIPLTSKSWVSFIFPCLAELPVYTENAPQCTTLFDTMRAKFTKVTTIQNTIESK